MLYGEIGFIEGYRVNKESTAMPVVKSHGSFKTAYSDRKLLSKAIFYLDGEPTQELTVLWDTGSSVTIIDPAIIDRLLVLPLAKDGGVITSVIGKDTDVPIYEADIHFLNDSGIVLSQADVFTIPVANKGVHAIIGMDVISLGILSVSGDSFSFEA